MKRRFLKSVCTESILMNSVFLYTQWIDEYGSIEYEMIRADIFESCILDYEYGLESSGIEKYERQYIPLGARLVELSEDEYKILINMLFEYNRRVYNFLSYYVNLLSKFNYEDENNKLKNEYKNIFKFVENRRGELDDRYFQDLDLRSVMGEDDIILLIDRFYSNDVIKNIISNMGFINRIDSEEASLKNKNMDEIYDIYSYIIDKMENYTLDNIDIDISEQRFEIYDKLSEKMTTNNAFIHYFTMKLVNEDRYFMKFMSLDKDDRYTKLGISRKMNYKRIILELFMLFIPHSKDVQEKFLLELILNIDSYKSLRRLYLEEGYSMIINRILSDNCIEKLDKAFGKCIPMVQSELREALVDTTINNGNKTYKLELSLIYRKDKMSLGLCNYYIDSYKILRLEQYDSMQMLLGYSEREFVSYEYEFRNFFDIDKNIADICDLIEKKYRGIYKTSLKFPDSDKKMFLYFKYRIDNDHVNNDVFYLDDDREFLILIQEKSVFLICLSYIIEENYDVILELGNKNLRFVDSFEVDEFDIEFIKSNGLTNFLG